MHTCAFRSRPDPVNPAKGPTLKELARRAGVSHSTVSRALNNHPALARATVERIQRLARELHYVPSAAARSLKTSRSRVLGVIVNRIADPFYSEVLGGLQSVAHAHGYSLFVSACEYDDDREADLIRVMLSRQVDALILGSSHFTSQRLAGLGGLRVPHVFIHNRAVEVLPHSIDHDDERGTRALTRHLLELGHRRIAFGGNQRGGRLQRQRRAGVLAELRAAGLDLPPHYDLAAPDGRLSSGAALAEQLLRLGRPPTALVCFNDMQALGLMQALQQAGRRLPEDLSVAGFDDLTLTALVHPALTTYHQPTWELGQVAAHAALVQLGEAVDDPRAAEPIITLPGRLVVRRSTASPRAEERWP